MSSNENKNKFPVQFGTSYCADFDSNRWSFEMDPGYKSRTGQFAIIPKEQYEGIERAITDQDKQLSLLRGENQKLSGMKKVVEEQLEACLQDCNSAQQENTKLREALDLARAIISDCRYYGGANLVNMEFEKFDEINATLSTLQGETKDGEADKQLGLARAQLTGFVQAEMGYHVTSVLKDIGLDKSEWDQIKEGLSMRSAERDDIEKYFESLLTNNK